MQGFWGRPRWLPAFKKRLECFSGEVTVTGSTDLESLKRAAGEAALAYVREGQVVGLGTGSTVRYFLEALGARVRGGLRVQGVPTSRETAALASREGIPLLPEEEEWRIDVAVDGADQIDPQLNLIKGGGGALLREKIVAAAASKVVIIADHTKWSAVLGRPVPLPVEVIPFGWPNTARTIEALGGKTVIRRRQGVIVQTELGHYILDFYLPVIDNPARLEQALNNIPGVVENGLFVGRARHVLLATPDGVQAHDARDQ